MREVDVSEEANNGQKLFQIQTLILTVFRLRVLELFV